MTLLLHDLQGAGASIRLREWSVGWGTLALINAGLAQGKHRSGLNWFLLSMLLGPLATLFLLLQDDPTEREEEEPPPGRS